ncbi:MAG: anti-sigma factor family protein [Candidatus Zixiibacteriota bacterium]
MSLSYVSDEEIQEYLDGNMSSREIRDFRQRLENCESSQKRLREYTLLYKALKEERIAGCTADFENAVMEKLPAEEEQDEIFNLSNLPIILIGLLVTLGITAYFVDFSPIFAKYLASPLFHYEINWAVFNPLVEAYKTAGDKYYIAGFVILVLMLIKFVDYMFLETEYEKIGH